MNDVQSSTTRRVAVVGLDGSGKSTVINRLRELCSDGQRHFASVTCPSFHETPDAPLHRLSETMGAFSHVADELGSFDLKALAMYLQMTLYGPVERHFVETWHPGVLVCERHPLVDSLVYGPFYVHLTNPDWDGNALAAKAQRLLDAAAGSGAFESVLYWHDAEAARLGFAGSVWDMLGDVVDILGRDTIETIKVLGNRYRTTLPDHVIWLDVPADEAAARCAARAADGHVEMHETPEFLAGLRERYMRTRDDLLAAFPDLQFHTISTAVGVTVAESVDICLAEARLFERM